MVELCLILPLHSPVGLLNVGNTCYVNSLLQAYFHLDFFRNMVLSLKLSLPVSWEELTSSTNNRFLSLVASGGGDANTAGASAASVARSTTSVPLVEIRCVCVCVCVSSFLYWRIQCCNEKETVPTQIQQQAALHLLLRQPLRLQATCARERPSRTLLIAARTPSSVCASIVFHCSSSCVSSLASGSFASFTGPLWVSSPVTTPSR